MLEITIPSGVDPRFSEGGVKYRGVSLKQGAVRRYGAFCSENTKIMQDLLIPTIISIAVLNDKSPSLI